MSIPYNLKNVNKYYLETFSNNLLDNIMNKLSKTTKEIVENIDNLNLHFDKVKPQHISTLNKHITSIYDKINYTILSSNTVKNLKNNNYCSVFSLFEYLKNNNLINNFIKNNIEYNGKKYSFENIIKNKNIKVCKLWVNIYGRNLLRYIYTLKSIEKIPEIYLKELDPIDEDILSEFTPIDIFEFIGNNNLVTSNYLIEFNVNDTKIKLNLKIISKGSIEKNEFDKCVKRIILMFRLKKTILLKELQITLLFTDFKKRLPVGHYKKLGPREINSGYTTFASKKIVIYRYEEYSKLLVHELVHLLGMDFVYLNIDISKYVDIHKDIEIRVNESFTELLTIIINSILVSKELGNKDDKVVSSFINYEITYNLFQCAKILNHFGYTKVDEFFIPHNGKSKKFEQSTSVFSYFFIKTAILFNFNDLLSLLNKSMDNFNLINKNKSISEYTRLFEKSINNNDFKYALSQFLKKVKNKRNNSNTFFYNTLRMTCIQLE